MKEIVLGNRVLFLDWDDEFSDAIRREFVEFVMSNEDVFTEVMDEYEIPEEVFLRFLKGDGDLEGMYHWEGRDVMKNAVLIDLYTRPLGNSFDMIELAETFIHELVHNKIRDDYETERIAQKIVDRLVR